ncbi:MAG: hypothetical protein KAW92_11620 [Candidatus Cloacimonetes bacterium]|nr:hypothetical protein [Candidatus Cloacimonadota bacterium]
MVIVNGKEYITPTVIKLKKGTEYELEFTKEGYEPVTMKIDKEFDTWVIGNLILGGPVGLVIDFLSGAMYKLTPDEVNAQLTKKQAKEFGMGIEINDDEYEILVIDLEQLNK